MMQTITMSMSMSMSLLRDPESFLAEVSQNQREYVDCFLQNLREKEAKRCPIRFNSPQLQYRGSLIMHLKNVSSKFTLGTRVLLLGVRILDLFMDSHDINSDRLLHVALICLFIAAKFEIKEPHVRKFSEFCGACDSTTLPQKLLCDYEWMILQHVNWNLCEPTAATFVEVFTPFAITKNDYFLWCKTGNKQNVPYERFEKWIKNRVKTFLGITLLDMRLGILSPSLIGAGCIQAARKLLGLGPWLADLENLTNHTVENTMSLATRLEKMLYVTVNSKRKRHLSESSDDQGYDTCKSSPDMKRYRTSASSS